MHFRHNLDSVSRESLLSSGITHLSWRRLARQLDEQDQEQRGSRNQSSRAMHIKRVRIQLRILRPALTVSELLAPATATATV